ncbi:MAG TPA: cobalt-precorrin-4/precorrin-4 C(11)-methyltransferase [Candidatus Atribacteria bacterium]|nr:cobalt-precorrin-4/precorrin-4 C(11)-methyltransferase [Candidatus Atribacteria bacterium]
MGNWDKIYIIGTGPGDPELLTIKGERLIKESDIIIYANPSLTKDIVDINKSAEKIESYNFTLDEIIGYIRDNFPQKKIVRLHSGDPSIYSSVFEETEKLKEFDIPFEIVPGISSFLAASAKIARTYTLPGVSQSLILSRIEGNTPLPERESLSSLSTHRVSMVIFLSVKHAEKVQEELLVSYPPDTPLVIAYRVSKPDEKVLWTRLSELSKTVKREGIERTALILVGEFLVPPPHIRSYLFNKR